MAKVRQNGSGERAADRAQINSLWDSFGRLRNVARGLQAVRVWQSCLAIRGDAAARLLAKVTKDAVVQAHANLPKGVDEATQDMILFGAAGRDFKVYNTSPLTFAKIKGQDAAQLHDNLVSYIMGFSPKVRDIFLDKFLFTDQLKRLKEAGTLFQVFDRFCQVDLHPKAISNLEMGYLFEELIRRFSEISNETAGEHFTPREVIRLIVDLLIANDDDKISGKGIIRQVYDPACGTGGMLALTEEALKEFNPSIRVELLARNLTASRSASANPTCWSRVMIPSK